MKVKPDASPYKQIPDDMHEKQFKAENWSQDILVIDLNQFYNEAINCFMEYLIFCKFHTTCKRY